MRAGVLTIKGLLEDDQQYRIPIYQRSYDWGEKQCRRLYEDIKNIASEGNDARHFIGAITYILEDASPGGLIKRQVIDGQQRLTTILLLLVALKNSLRDGMDNNDIKTEIECLLHNQKKDGMDHRKLILTEDDDEDLKDIIENGKSDGTELVTSNYKWFRRNLRDDSPDQIWRGICRLTVVYMELEQSDHRKAQEIFESMNSTGLDLSQTDLIKNYVLMNNKVDIQNNIYKKYWKPMEDEFEDDNDFGEFLRCYIIIKKRGNVNKGDLYEEFKNHIHCPNIEKEMKEIHRYSKYYSILIYKDTPEEMSELIKKPKAVTREMCKAINNIRNMYTSVANSLLLKILVDRYDDVIGEGDAVNIFQLVDSYILRCEVHGTGLKTANKTFPEIIKKIEPDDYAQSIQYAIMQNNSVNRKFPRDMRFKDSFKQRQIYLNANVCKYVLERIEEYWAGKERVKMDELQIEHIMPQKLSESWRNDLGPDCDDINENYGHIIGNLTLTGYNPELSNLPFAKKKVMYEKSILKLNRKLCEYERWGEDEIRERTKILADAALNIWKCPPGPDVESITDDMEEEHLEGCQIVELWEEVKKRICTIDDSIEFYMSKAYGGFRAPIKDSEKLTTICYLEARKNKIHLTYNVKVGSGVIEESKFIKDISNVGHHGSGDLKVIITSMDNIDQILDDVIKVWIKRTKQ